jgi:glucan phosphoethanolaminetransferase (alkaline phosphatase superfamily)
MRKFFKLLFPVITGILVILGILKVDDLIKDMIAANFNFNTSDMGNIVFYYVLIPVALLLALLIHWIFILPVIRKLDVKPTFWRLRLMHYIILISIIAAAVVGYIFWRKTESINDVVLAVITSFILFFVYFIITVLLSKGIDHFDNKLKDNNVYETPKPDDNLTSKI